MPLGIDYKVTFSKEFNLDAVDPIDALQQGRRELFKIMEEQNPGDFDYEIKFKGRTLEQIVDKTFTNKVPEKPEETQEG